MKLFNWFKKSRKPINNPNTYVAEHNSSPEVKVNITMTNNKCDDVPKKFEDIVEENKNAEDLKLKQLISKSYPSKNGLYPHEILMLGEATYHSDDCSNSDFCHYWLYKYHVTNPKQILNSLFDRDFIRYANPEELLKKTVIANLKTILNKYNLSPTGKKATLIQRLLDEVPSEQLLKELPKKTYALTEKGQKELDDNSYVPFIHKGNYNIDIWEINVLKHEKPNYPIRDLIWGNYNKLTLEHFKNLDFVLYRYTKYDMARFLMEEKKYSGALTILSEVIFYALSGLDNNCKPDNIYMSTAIQKKFWFPYENSLIQIPPGILQTLIEIKEQLNLSDEKLKQRLTDDFGRLHLFFQIFTTDECVEIVVSELNKDPNTLEKIYSIAEKRLEKTLINKLGKEQYESFKN